MKFLLSAFALSLAAAPCLAAQTPKTVRWVLAHTRDDAAYAPLFDSFAQRVAEKSHGTLRVDFVGKDAVDADPDELSHKMVLEGAADMGQFEKDVARHAPAITAPFAFRDYEHAEAVFGGSVGKGLLDGMYAGRGRKLRALAFTYSGGRRVFFGSAPLRKVSDFKGQRMESPGSDGWSTFMDEVMTDAGVELVADADAFDAKAADQFEGVVNRGPEELALFPAAREKIRFVNRTHHGLLVTAIVANEKFLSGLSAEQRRVLADEVEILALKERRLSVELEPKRLAELTKMGMTAVELPAAERGKLMILAEKALKKNPAVYRVIQEIRSVKVGPHTAGL